MADLEAPDTPLGLAERGEVDILRHCWAQQFERIKETVRILDPKEMREAARPIESPYEVEARYTTKGRLHWFGYKVHLTKTCDAGLPHLIAHVQTTLATATDVKQLTAIQNGLTASGLVPVEHLADAAYVCGSNLVSSHTRHIALIGPTYADRTWKAKQGDGFELAHFRIDWDAKTVTCPQWRQSLRWSETQAARGRRMLHIEFAPNDCTPCPSRALCTRAKHLPRSLTVQPQEEHEAVQFARQRQQTEAFAAL